MILMTQHFYGQALTLLGSLVAVVSHHAVSNLILTTTLFSSVPQLDIAASITQFISKIAELFTINQFFDFKYVVAAITHERVVPAVFAVILFSSIIAFKLAFLRHLCRVHASARPGAWRED